MMLHFDVGYHKKTQYLVAVFEPEDEEEINWNQRIWEYIVAYTKVKGFPPILREIIRGTEHVNSISVLMGRIRELELMERVHVTPGVARGIIAVNVSCKWEQDLHESLSTLGE